MFVAIVKRWGAGATFTKSPVLAHANKAFKNPFLLNQIRAQFTSSLPENSLSWVMMAKGNPYQTDDGAPSKKKARSKKQAEEKVENPKVEPKVEEHVQSDAKKIAKKKKDTRTSDEKKNPSQTELTDKKVNHNEPNVPKEEPVKPKKIAKPKENPHLIGKDSSEKTESSLVNPSRSTEKKQETNQAVNTPKNNIPDQTTSQKQEKTTSENISQKKDAQKEEKSKLVQSENKQDIQTEKKIEDGKSEKTSESQSVQTKQKETSEKNPQESPKSTAASLSGQTEKPSNKKPEKISAETKPETKAAKEPKVKKEETKKSKDDKKVKIEDILPQTEGGVSSKWSNNPTGPWDLSEKGLKTKKPEQGFD